MELNENRIALAKYRLETAKTCLATARRDAEADDLKASVNRSYYALFHAIRAVLALDGLDFKKHSAVIGKFRELYIKSGIFNEHFSDVIGKSFIVRNNSDYEDFYVISREDALQQIENVAAFLENVCLYLTNRINEAAE